MAKKYWLGISALIALLTISTAQGAGSVAGAITGPTGATGPTGVFDTSSAPGIVSTTSRTFYVSKDGSDAVCPATPCGDGSLAKPFLTLKTAIAATASLTLTLDNPWTIQMGPGLFNEISPLTFRTYVYIQGAGNRHTFLRTNDAAVMKWTGADVAGSIARVVIKDLQTVATPMEFTRAPGSVAGSSVVVENIAFGSAFTATGAGLGLDSVEYINNRTPGGSFFNAQNTTIADSIMIGTQILFTQAGVDSSAGPSVAAFHHTSHRRINVSDASTISLYNSPFTSLSVTFNGPLGTVTAFDSTSVPTAAFTLNSGATAAQFIKAGRASFIGVQGSTGMTSAGNWSPSVPLDFNEALDRIINNVVSLNLGPIGATVPSYVNALATVGASPNANGATLTGNTLNLEPASEAFPGVVTTAAQTFAGTKTIKFGSPGPTTYVSGGAQIDLNSAADQSALVMRAEGSQSTVEAALGVYGGAGATSLFLGTLDATPTALYTNGADIHLAVGLGTSGLQTHLYGDTSGNAGYRTATGAVLTTFANSTGDPTHFYKAVDESDAVLASVDLTGGFTGGTVTPRTNNTFNLGSSASRFATTYTSTVTRSSGNVAMDVENSLLKDSASNDSLDFASRTLKFATTPVLSWNSATVVSATAHLAVTPAGNGLRVSEGSNAKQGVATLVAGTVTVSNTSVTATSRIFLTCQDPNGGTPGALYISARTAATSFDITSTSGTDTCIVAYQIFEPA